MQSLPPALFLVLLELTVGAFVTLYLLDRRGDTSRSYIVFQGVLYAIFALLTYGAMQAFATPAVLRGYGLDGAWLAWQGPLVLIFMLLLVPWNVLLWLSPDPKKRRKSRVDEVDDEPASPASGDVAPETAFGAVVAVKQPAEAKARTAQEAAAAGRRVVLARHSVGGLTALVGLAAVFVVGMAYRPLADAHLGGAFVVAAFLAGAIALGGVTTAMLLGHWYLNTPTASGKPLEFSTMLLLGGLILELAFLLLAGPSTAHPLPGSAALAPGTTIGTSGNTIVVTTPTPVPPGVTAPPTVQREAPLGTDALVWLQYLLGFGSPLILGAVSLYLARGRSFQSATG